MLTEWSDLQTVFWLAETGSLSAAARALGTSQSTMSRRLAAVERQLSAPLFDRTPAGFVPTPIGRAVVERCRAMHSAFDEVRGLLAGATAVRIATCEVLARHFVLPALVDWRRETGGVGEVSVFDSTFEPLGTGFDILVTPRESAPADMTGRVFARMAWGLYASPDHLGALGSGPVPERLDGLPVINAAGPLGDVAACRAFLDRGGDTVLSANDLTSQREAAAAGLGIALLPVMFAADDPRVVALPRRGDEPVTDVWIGARPEVAAQERIAGFLTWFRSRRSDPVLTVAA